MIGWVAVEDGSMSGLLREVANEVDAIEAKRRTDRQDTEDLTGEVQHMFPDHNMWQCKHPDCVTEQKRHGIHTND